jgi:hypothetical protein
VSDGPSPFSSYPARRVVSVLDRPAAGPEVVAALQAEGFDADDIDVLTGAGSLQPVRPRDRAKGVAAQVRRWFAFTLMDQLPDFLLYERALHDGRAVVMVRAETDDAKTRAHEVLRRHGGHFSNYYGRFATEELDLWRGPEPEMPDFLRR